MKVLFLFGNAAVGKMTVGQALSSCTQLRLFHNHMTIEPVLEVFGTFHVPCILRMRDVVFEEFGKTQAYGLIYTFMWAFDEQEDWAYLAHVKSLFPPETTFYYVELVASQQVRLARNTTENRLKHKASKRDLEASRGRLLRDDQAHRLESKSGEIPFPNYLKIDNSARSPQEVAAQIKEAFQF